MIKYNFIMDLYRKTGVFALVAAILYIIFYILLDRPIIMWVHSHWAETWIFYAGEYISYSAHGPPVRLALALAFILIVVYDPGLKKPWIRNLLYICLTVAIAIVIGEGFKYLLSRHRPIMLIDQNSYGLHFFSTEWAYNSTPSGHTIRAFSLLAALSMLFRRFTIGFIFIAVLVGVSRVVVTDHYPSDIIFGAFMGTFTALWTYKFYFTGKYEGDPKVPDVEKTEAPEVKTTEAPNVCRPDAPNSDM